MERYAKLTEEQVKTIFGEKIVAELLEANAEYNSEDDNNLIYSENTYLEDYNMHLWVYYFIDREASERIEFEEDFDWSNYTFEIELD